MGSCGSEASFDHRPQRRRRRRIERGGGNLGIKSCIMVNQDDCVLKLVGLFNQDKSSVLLMHSSGFSLCI